MERHQKWVFSLGENVSLRLGVFDSPHFDDFLLLDDLHGIELLGLQMSAEEDFTVGPFSEQLEEFEVIDADFLGVLGKEESDLLLVVGDLDLLEEQTERGGVHQDEFQILASSFGLGGDSVGVRNEFFQIQIIHEIKLPLGILTLLGDFEEELEELASVGRVEMEVLLVLANDDELERLFADHESKNVSNVDESVAVLLGESEKPLVDFERTGPSLVTKKELFEGQREGRFSAFLLQVQKVIEQFHGL